MITIENSPEFSAEECPTVVIAILRDPQPSAGCLYTISWIWPSGMNELDASEAERNSPVGDYTHSMKNWEYPVLPNVPYTFIVRAETEGTITIAGIKYCPPQGESYPHTGDEQWTHEVPSELEPGDMVLWGPPIDGTVDSTVKPFEVKDCSEVAAILGGLGAGMTTTALGLAIAAGTKVGGGLGSFGGPIGLIIGLAAGAIVGGIVYYIAKPDCCPSQGTLPGGQRRKRIP